MQQQLCSLMLETVQRVLQVAEGIRGASEELVNMLVKMYLSPEQPSWHFEGHCFMYQLKTDLAPQQPQIFLNV